MHRSGLGVWLLGALVALMAGLAGAQMIPLIEDEGLPDDGNPLKASGTVRGPGGPAEGVRVLLEVSDMRIRRQVAYLETRTDTEGRFEFDLREHDFPEYGLEFITVSRRFVETTRILVLRRSELPLELDLEVQPGTIAQGIVTDEQGTPLPGVRISAPGVRQQESDSEGRWEVFGIPGFAELRFFKDGYAELFLPVRTDSPQVVEGLEVKLESARVLAGEVVDWAGKPVPYAVVMLQAPGSYQQQGADGEGRFQFRGVPEDLAGVFLEVMSPGYLPTIREFTEEERAKQEVRVVIDSGVFVKGRVSLPSGGAASGAKVTAGMTHGANSPQCVADAKGAWSLGPFPRGEEITFTVLPPAMDGSWGIADLLVSPRRGSPGTYDGRVELWPKGFSSDLTITLQGEAVSMTRLDQGDGGLPGEIHYRGTHEAAANEVRGTLEVPGLEQKGTFTMRMLVRRGDGLHGEWELREEIEPSTLAVAPTQEIVRTPMIAGTVIADLTLASPQSISGEVRRADGLPFIDGTVYLRDWNGTEVYRPEAKIEAGGRFRLDRLPEGTFLLQAVSGDRQHATEPMVVRGGIEGVQLLEEPGPDPSDD